MAAKRKYKKIPDGSSHVAKDGKAGRKPGSKTKAVRFKQEATISSMDALMPMVQQYGVLLGTLGEAMAINTVRNALEAARCAQVVPEAKDLVPALVATARKLIESKAAFMHDPMPAEAPANLDTPSESVSAEVARGIGL